MNVHANYKTTASRVPGRLRRSLPTRVRRALTVSISEGAAIFTLEHDPDCPNFDNCGAPVTISDRVFVGARALILPDVTLGEGCVVAAGSVVTRDIEAYTNVGGVPTTPIGRRRADLTYTLDYREFLG